MTVRSRLLLTILGITALLMVPSVYSLTRLKAVQEITEQIQRENAAAILALGRLQTSLAELEGALRSYVATPGPEFVHSVEQRLGRAKAGTEELRRAGFPRQAERAGARVDSLESATRRLEALIEAGSREEATNRLRAEVSPLLTLAQDSLALVAEAIDRNSIDQVREAQMISASAVTTVILGLFGTLAAALLLGLWTTGALTVPLRRLQRATASVTSGRFEITEPLPYQRSDEIGDLSRSFRAMATQLAELDRLKAEFLSMASHDLKTPINVVGGYAELLEAGVYGDVNQRQKEVLRTIQEQLGSLTGQVNHLLNVSRMEAGGFRLTMGDVIIPDLVAGVQRTFAALADQKSIAFSVDVDPRAPARITGDGDRLRNEVLGNLLSNAFKFTPEEGSIWVRVRPEGTETLSIEVSDSGKGIPRQEIPHIFDKFYQVGAAERRIGTGLGLAIARQVVQAHNGRIDVESELGRGTTFTVRLPVEQPEGQRTGAVVVQDEPTGMEAEGPAAQGMRAS